jgi:hypothetical protein
MSSLLDRLRVHGLADEVAAIAARHGVPVIEAVDGDGPAVAEVWTAIRAKGWSAANITRVFGLAEPGPKPKEVRHAPRRAETAAPSEATAGDSIPEMDPGRGQRARRAPPLPTTPPTLGLSPAHAEEVEDEEVEADDDPPVRAWRGAPPAKPRVPSTAPVLHLPIVQTTQLSSPAELFRCLPYQATIAASTCIARQAAHGTRGDRAYFKKSAPTRWSNGKGAVRDFGKCRNCEMGRGVVSRLRNVQLPLAGGAA